MAGSPQRPAVPWKKYFCRRVPTDEQQGAGAADAVQPDLSLVPGCSTHPVYSTPATVPSVTAQIRGGSLGFERKRRGTHRWLIVGGGSTEQRRG
jgi:hypothetical protein